MEAPRKKISIVTKVFSVFLAITALDLSAIYIFTGTGQIDQIGRNGILLAENAAFRILQILPQEKSADPLSDNQFQKRFEAMSRAAALEFKNCAVVAPDGKVIGDANGKISPGALRALKFHEAEGRLFYADLTLADFSADLYIPFRPGKDMSQRVFTCTLPLASIRESFERLMRISLIILILTLAMQAGLAWFIYVIFIRRLKKLEISSERMAQGDFSGEFTPGKRFDEIDHLGFTFNEMRLALAEKTRVLEDTLVDLEKANFNLEGDLILGEEIQQSTLPLRSAGRGIKWQVSYLPMSRVSGDYYDVFDLAGGATGILEFDASGHGVPAALLTMMAKISFVEAIQKSLSPNQVIAAVNDELSQHLQKTGNFLTAFYAVIRPNGKVVYCNAAHTRVLLVRTTGQVELLDPTSLSIGFAPPGGDSFHSAEVTLMPGDRLIIYTDGLTESRTKQGLAFETEGLVSVVEKIRKLDLAEMHKGLMAEWENRINRKSVEDDVTVVSVELA